MYEDVYDDDYDGDEDEDDLLPSCDDLPVDPVLAEMQRDCPELLHQLMRDEDEPDEPDEEEGEIDVGFWV